MSSDNSHTVLLTGATGFVGSHLYPALTAAGFSVRGLTRSPRRAQERWPHRDFIGGDLLDGEALELAMAGCEAAVYLVHSMGEGEKDFRHHEEAAARCFVRSARRAGLSRIVYLGGMVPRGHLSEHLCSRRTVGEVLRLGAVPTIELRASMIVGHGSASWEIVRDLAARLPVMVLPRWLASRTQPNAIADVLTALCGALKVPLYHSTWFGIPGPETLSGRQILEETARQMGLPPPHILSVPFLSPHLSAQWLRLVTRADYLVARELVAGLVGDVLAHDERFFRLTGQAPRLSFAEAVRRALAEDDSAGALPGPWSAFERLRMRYGV